MQAWKLGCKGFTVYRDGSRDGVLTSGEAAKEKETVHYHNAPKRPDLMDCEVYRANVAGDQWTIFLGLMDGKPYEIMGGLSKYIDLPKKVKTGLIRKNRKKGANNTYDFISLIDTEDEIVVKDLSAVFENPNYGAFSRTISLALRHGVPVQYVVEQLQKGDKDSDLFSFAKVMARVFKGKIKDGTKISATCSECKSQDIEYREGCATCMSCGYSKCG
jgi:ribonucleoside-diphosphate reductase alpha chain